MLSMLVFFLVGCGTQTPDPDAVWEVTLTGDSTNCFDSTEGYQNQYNYQIYYPSSDATTEIRIDGELFASGFTSGCTIEYSTPTWLEERDQGYLKWSIEGTAEAQQGAGGCSIAKKFDWYGTETITVEESTDPEISEGCTYTLTTTGFFKGSGG